MKIIDERLSCKKDYFKVGQIIEDELNLFMIVQVDLKFGLVNLSTGEVMTGLQYDTLSAMAEANWMLNKVDAELVIPNEIQ
ncbi:hypothetical protein [Lactiplantibacillus herbarum]|uniref:hypothetical protein n=1 Tax=Lactiplantibacillus herbarum TaxID=1670446 RepID=UPI00064E8941|nr:hypothetical protein [Lactiplantibacillus herbarum]